MFFLGEMQVPRLLLPFAFFSLAFAGEAVSSGPLGGVLVDNESRMIRPIVGLTPGGAYAGSPAVREMDFGVASPDGTAALVGRDGWLYVVRRLDGARPVWRQLGEDKPEGPVAWSQDGKSLAMVTEGGKRVDLWRGLDTGDPQKAGSIDFTYFDETITALAVDSEAQFAFAAARHEGGGTVFLLKAGEIPRPLLDVGRPGRLLLTGTALYVADRGRSEVLRLSDWDQSPKIATVATPGHGLADPVGIALAPNGEVLFVASAGSRQVAALDAETGAVRHVRELDFRPRSLEPLSRGAYLLLDSGVPGESPAQVMDSRTFQVFFIPVSALPAAD